MTRRNQRTSPVSSRSQPELAKRQSPDLVVLLLSSLVLSMIAGVAVLVAARQPAYAAPSVPWQGGCNSAASCPGQDLWCGNCSLWGGQSEIETSTITPSLGSIKNRIVLHDTNPTDLCGIYGPYFEGGYVGRADNGQTWYYSEDCPLNGSGVRTSFQYQVPSNNYGYYWYYRIYRYNSTTLEVDFFYDNWTYYWSGYSTLNFMSVNEIDLGMWAYNNSSPATASTAYFRNNQYENSVGFWGWLGGAGTLNNTNPPSWGWDSVPNTGNNNGGLGHTCWC